MSNQQGFPNYKPHSLSSLPSFSIFDELPTPPKKTPEPAAPPPQKSPPMKCVVQFPKQHVFCYPTPEDARRFEVLTRRGLRKSGCRRYCCFVLCLVIFLIIGALVSPMVLDFIFRFKTPEYSVERFGVKGMNLTSGAPVSPEFDVTIRVENPNGKLGIHYLESSDVRVFYDDVKLSDGVLPAFYQAKGNVTVVRTELKGSEVVLGSSVAMALRKGQQGGKVLFVVRFMMHVKIKVGYVKMFKIKCDVLVDSLDEGAKIISTTCDPY